MLQHRRDLRLLRRCGLPLRGVRRWEHGGLLERVNLARPAAAGHRAAEDRLDVLVDLGVHHCRELPVAQPRHLAFLLLLFLLLVAALVRLAAALLAPKHSGQCLVQLDRRLGRAVAFPQGVRLDILPDRVVDLRAFHEVGAGGSRHDARFELRRVAGVVLGDGRQRVLAPGLRIARQLNERVGTPGLACAGAGGHALLLK